MTPLEALRQCRDALIYADRLIYIADQPITDAIAAADAVLAQPQEEPVGRPLTARQIGDIAAKAPLGDDWEAALWIARAVERAHGIGHE